jgi:hypothetical protein
MQGESPTLPVRRGACVRVVGLSPGGAGTSLPASCACTAPVMIAAVCARGACVISGSATASPGKTPATRPDNAGRHHRRDTQAGPGVMKHAPMVA